MVFSGRSVVVTGAGGFIGSHVVQQLLQYGANVKAFVHYNSQGTRGFLDDLSSYELHELEIFQGDLRDAYAVEQVVRGSDIVLHLGALIAIPYSYRNPADVIQTNVLGTLNIAQACLKHDVSRLVHTSTSEVYGTARYVPMDESHPLQGQSPYSASKIGADKVIESFFSSYGLPVVTVRPFNAYGPRQSMRAVIPTIINQALHQPEIRLGLLTPTRDFTFVEDTARAFLLAAQTGGIEGEVVNAGSEHEISIGQLAEKIRAMIRNDIPIVSDEARTRPDKSEVNRLFSNSQKAKKLMGWQSFVSLDEGLQRTIRWMESHGSLYRPADYVV